jgi:hypothetical protein
MPTDNRGGKHAPNGRGRGEEDPEAQGGLSTEGKGREQEEWRPSTALVPSLRAREMWSSVGDSWKRFSRLRNRSSHVAAVEGTSSEGDLIRSNARLDAAMGRSGAVRRRMAHPAKIDGRFTVSETTRHCNGST